MEHNFHTLHGALHRIVVADIDFVEVDGAAHFVEIALKSSKQIVDNDNLAGALVEKATDKRGTDETRPAGDKKISLAQTSIVASEACEPACQDGRNVDTARTPSNTVQVFRKGMDRVHGGHPWIFRSDVQDIGKASPGEIVRVAGPKGEHLGFAYFSSSSQIALRMLPDRTYGESIEIAQQFREQIVTDSDSYRLVHAEADFMPALIIDRYADCFAVQALNQGMDRALPEIVAELERQFSPRAIVARNDSAVRTLEELPREVRVVSGELDEPVAIHMNGFKLEVDLLQGQKTGVYLDQRENYLAVARFASGRALDCFTSTGGFALHLARTCEHVEAVDSSAGALATAKRNATVNDLSNIDFREADAFELLSGYASARRHFDVVVLDPPAFAKNRKQLDGAMRGYKDINLRALRLLSPGGILVTNSCSHHMSEQMLMEIAAEASLDAGKTLRVLDRRTQAQDHPILLTVPETLYLKCLILQVT